MKILWKFDGSSSIRQKFIAKRVVFKKKREGEINYNRCFIRKTSLEFIFFTSWKPWKNKPLTSSHFQFKIVGCDSYMWSMTFLPQIKRTSPKWGSKRFNDIKCFSKCTRADFSNWVDSPFRFERAPLCQMLFGRLTLAFPQCFRENKNSHKYTLNPVCIRVAWHWREPL